MEGRGCAGGEAGVDAGLQKILASATRSGAAGLVLHEPGHFVAIRSADLALPWPNWPSGRGKPAMAIGTAFTSPIRCGAGRLRA